MVAPIAPNLTIPAVTGVVVNPKNTNRLFPGHAASFVEIRPIQSSDCGQKKSLNDRAADAQPLGKDRDVRVTQIEVAANAQVPGKGCDPRASLKIEVAANAQVPGKGRDPRAAQIEAAADAQALG